MRVRPASARDEGVQGVGGRNEVAVEGMELIPEGLRVGREAQARHLSYLARQGQVDGPKSARVRAASCSRIAVSSSWRTGGPAEPQRRGAQEALIEALGLEDELGDDPSVS